jgi:hypothetical protein
MANHGPANTTRTPHRASRHPRGRTGQPLISNRNKNAVPPFFMRRESPFTKRHARITNYFTNGACRAAVGFAERVILLDTNGRDERGCLLANSFETNVRANFYSIQTDDFYLIQIVWRPRSRQPACHVKRRPCTSWRDSLKMLGLR